MQLVQKKQAYSWPIFPPFQNPGAIIVDTLLSDAPELIPAGDSSTGTPDLHVFANNLGLNIFSYTDDAESNFQLNSVAFRDSSTWTTGNYIGNAALGTISTTIETFTFL